MVKKQRLVIGIIFIITSIVVAIIVVLGIKENYGMVISFLCTFLMFLWVGVWQIIFHYILKSKEKKLHSLKGE